MYKNNLQYHMKSIGWGFLAYSIFVLLINVVTRFTDWGQTIYTSVTLRDSILGKVSYSLICTLIGFITTYRVEQWAIIYHSENTPAPTEEKDFETSDLLSNGIICAVAAQLYSGITAAQYNLFRLFLVKDAATVIPSILWGLGFYAVVFFATSIFRISIHVSEWKDQRWKSAFVLFLLGLVVPLCFGLIAKISNKDHAFFDMTDFPKYLLICIIMVGLQTLIFEIIESDRFKENKFVVSIINFKSDVLFGLIVAVFYSKATISEKNLMGIFLTSRENGFEAYAAWLFPLIIWSLLVASSRIALGIKGGDKRVEKAVAKEVSLSSTPTT